MLQQSTNANIPNLIGVAGCKRQGKDTIGDYMVEHYGYTKIGFADSLKVALQAIFKFSDEQLYGDLKEITDDFWNLTPRNAMQTIGTDLMRNQFMDDVWVRCVERTITEAWKTTPFKKFVISDIRFPNEIDMVKRLSGKIIRITRPDLPDLAENHESESNIGSLVVDYDILNDGTIDELYKKVNCILHLSHMQLPIPKTLYHVWVGDQSMRPTNMLDTWRTKHRTEDGWECVLITEEEIARLGITFECQRQIDDMPEWNGKADIIRWEIMYQFGGVVMDADCHCVETLEDDVFLTPQDGWACYENETVRRDLVACGAMGFPPRSPLVRDILDHIKTLNLHPSVCAEKAWVTVANGLITTKLATNKYPGFKIFPSHWFIPYHYTGVCYEGHHKVYAYQEWGSTKSSYSNTNASFTLPLNFLTPPPAAWCSILIPSFNTPESFVRECLWSIQEQRGHVGMEVVWVDDGSDESKSAAAQKWLGILERTSRFITVKYHKLLQNRGVGAALHIGTPMCTHELILRMDADDIMLPARCLTQMNFMTQNPSLVVCGGQLMLFKSDEIVPMYNDRLSIPELASMRIDSQTNHPESLTFFEWMWTRSSWFANGATLCWRKSALVALDGGYDPGLRFMEDFDVELRAMKRYGKIVNLLDLVGAYRQHPDQLTANYRFDDAVAIRNQIINRLL